MLLLQSHYRGPVSVGQDNIDAVGQRARRPRRVRRRAPRASPPRTPDADVLAAFRERMDDDLDTPGATALLFDTVRRANAALDAGDRGCAVARGRGARDLHRVRVGAQRRRRRSCRRSPPRPPRSTRLAPPRTSPTADAIRAELQAAGWTVETTKAGTTVRR